ncbi:TauD/TfdA family dioxygenase [Phyllobacterium sp. YR531]|uniref:TauD/TfdA family dioxygenase n=1 Tax=Phyllobacterium sp. YR531 TaxID=1144343 RepID=UPI00026FBB95|nr:TauD/TfdA family dioxygenase [Phyllobacterium sp. YR531]EJM99424.1 Taurine catabolism dioxygenase TauD, TfdA family [Phyllobacterium sp. YR531]
MKNIYTLTCSDAEEIEDLIQSVLTSAQSEADLHKLAAYSAPKLPLPIREIFTSLLREDITPWLQLSGFAISDSAIGPTPSTTKRNPGDQITREEVYLAIVASALGVPYAFSTQQSGRLVQNIVPMKSAEFSQLGAGSREALVWHTEDAFSSNRPDYIILLGMRNPQKTPTTLGELPGTILPEERELLFRKNFQFIPDPDHAEHLKNTTTKVGQTAYARMKELVNNPPFESILFGSIETPYLRLDPAFTKIVAETDPSVPVYNRLVKEIDDTQKDFVIGSGDMLIIDNHRAVHGRRAFTPNYDGSDRWLKKINVTQNFKKMRESALHEQSFII